MRARRISSWVAAAIVIVLLCVGVALAFELGDADGVWGFIDTDGAFCDRWATGPSDGSVDYNNPTYISDSSPSVQNQDGLTEDWNQVRYGGSMLFGTYWCILSFGDQSGFGFDGANPVADPDPITDPFYLGKFCHFNNPISSNNAFEYVDLDITVDGLGCPGGGTIDKSELTFTYQFTLDETPNNQTPCPYLPGDPINDNGCADAVDVGAAAANETFTCDYGDGAVVTYTVSVVGFIPESVGGDCPGIYDPNNVSTQFISEEDQDNCACLWAKVTEYDPTAVDLLSFEATGARSAITLNWETATETDNLGFNLYRAEAVGGERVKINAELIPTNVPPGSPFGAAYKYTDKPNGRANIYYYWLEDVDVDGDAELHGPVQATMVGRPAVQELLRRVVPVKIEESAEGQTR